MRAAGLPANNAEHDGGSFLHLIAEKLCDRNVSLLRPSLERRDHLVQHFAGLLLRDALTLDHMRNAFLDHRLHGSVRGGEGSFFVAVGAVLFIAASVSIRAEILGSVQGHAAALAKLFVHVDNLHLIGNSYSIHP